MGGLIQTAVGWGKCGPTVPGAVVPSPLFSSDREFQASIFEDPADPGPCLLIPDLWSLISDLRFLISDL